MFRFIALAVIITALAGPSLLIPGLIFVYVCRFLTNQRD